MSASFVVYIDESGDEGFSFSKGSSRWFVLSGVVTRRVSDLETVKLVDQVRLVLGKPPKKPLHFRDLKHEQRLPFIQQIAQARIRAISVLLHKPSLVEPEKFRERYRLYFYAVRYLLERVSWFCRDNRNPSSPGDGSAEIVFSNRSGMSYEEMREYFLRLKRQTDILDVRIDWRVVKPEQITAFTPGRRMGLQIADAVASSFFAAVEPSRYGFTEDRYVRMLKPIVYHHKGQYIGYGLKFWPRETALMIQTDGALNWVSLLLRNLHVFRAVLSRFASQRNKKLSGAGLPRPALSSARSGGVGAAAG